MLTIDRFYTQYSLYQGTPDAALLQLSLDRLVRERLPGVLAEILPTAPEDAHAVYRIRRLRIDLWLDALNLQEGDVVRRWAHLIAQAVVRAMLYGSQDEVVRYEDAGHFLAAFLGDLLVGQAWQKWEYNEYHALEGLSAGQAAAYLLSARPDLIEPVAARLDAAGQLDRLLSQMSAGEARLIWERGLGFAGTGLALPASVDLPRLLSLPLQSRVHTLPMASGTPEMFERDRLRLYLCLTLDRPDLTGSREAAAVAHALAMIQWLRRVRPVTRFWQVLASGAIDSPTALAPLLTGLSQDDTPLRDWLAGLLAEPEGLKRLAFLAQATDAELAGTNQVVAVAQVTYTLFAGLGLLLPVLRQMDLFEQVGNDGLYQLLLNAVPPDFRPLAWSDPAPAILAGIFASETEMARARPVVWPVFQPDGDVDPVEKAFLPVTQVALRRFTKGIRGFEQSSLGFIVTQFINQPGRVEISPTRIEIFLATAPLGVLLSTSGRTGEQGSIPWLNNRRLAIFLPGE